MAMRFEYGDLLINNAKKYAGPLTNFHLLLLAFGKTRVVCCNAGVTACVAFVHSMENLVRRKGETHREGYFNMLESRTRFASGIHKEKIIVGNSEAWQEHEEQFWLHSSPFARLHDGPWDIFLPLRKKASGISSDQNQQLG